MAVAYFSLPLLLSLGAADLPGIMTVTIDPTVLMRAVWSVNAKLSLASVQMLDDLYRRSMA